MNDSDSIRFVFFGSSAFSVYVLEALKEKGFRPSLIVTFPDKPAGRKMILTPNPVKEWAKRENLKLLEAENFKDESVLEKLRSENAEVFVVASFGQILPDALIQMPKFQTLNVHPSLLPKLRGPSPIQTAILKEEGTGVSIMKLNQKMDEGPIIVEKKVDFPEWPLGYKEAEEKLGQEGGILLSSVLPQWIHGEIKETPQDQSLATYTKKITKEDGDITKDSPEKALKKIKAFEVWPKAYIYHTKKNGQTERIIVLNAHIQDGELVLDQVIPAGKKTMGWADYLKGN